MNQLAYRRPLGLFAVVALLASAGCGSDIAPNQPPPADRSTPNLAIRALEDTFSFREADAAFALLTPDYRFFPVVPDSISFLEPGAEFWDIAQEKAILDLLLVEERSTWLEQVLLDVHKHDQRDLPNGQVEFDARVELVLLVGLNLLSAESEITYLLEPDADGQYRIVEVRESASLQVGKKPVGQLLAESLEDRSGT